MHPSRVLNTRFVILRSLVALTAGCRSARRPDLWGEARHAGYMHIATAGVGITAEDGSFELNATQKPIPTPFKSSNPAYEIKDLLGKYPEFLQMGAKQVRVTYPGMAEPLYGLLALLSVHPEAKEPNVKRTYRIEIPASRASQAVGGLVQVVYRPYEYTGGANHRLRRGIFGIPVAGQARAGASSSSAAWVLWLSDAPFPLN